VQFEDYCHENALDPTSDAANYGFLVKDLHGEFRTVIDKLKMTTSLATAVEAFMNSYEKPGVPALSKRIQWAERAMAVFRPAA